MNSKYLFLTFNIFCICFCSQTARSVTKFDQILGLHISQAISQEIMGSPPLPSLEEKTKSHFRPMVSYLVAQANNSAATSSGGTAAYNAELKGWTAGMSLTNSSKHNMGFYLFATMSDAEGDIKSDESFSIKLKDMKTFGYNLSTGISYRLWSEKDFPLTIGVLAGPFASRFANEFVLDPIGYKYNSATFLYGPMVGAQGHVRILGLRLNPFFLQYFDLSNPCRTYSTSAPSAFDSVSAESSAGCSQENREIRMEGSFYSYGLNIEFWSISISAYSKVQKNSDLESVKVHNYAVSYSFNY